MSDVVTEMQRSLTPVLKPFSWVYGAGMRVREKLFNRGLMPSWEPPVLTVSVGNIGWGGTGKTPVAGWLLGWAETNGVQAVLLTRGYRSKAVSLPYEVHPEALAEEAGDEPLMLARDHLKAHIVVDPNRTRAGKMAIKKFQPDLLILDDGFQHMAVKRHLNLVLLKPDDLIGEWNRVVPAGSWREPKAALARADAFMIKTGPRGFERLEPFIEERLGHLHKPLFTFQIQPTGVRRVVDGQTALGFATESYLLVTGVGDPEQVQRTAKAYFGYSPVDHMIFKDHHTYTKYNVMNMLDRARKLGCKRILCTPKDAVKLGPMCTEEFWQFNLRVDFGPSTIAKDTTFETWWGRRYGAFDLRRADRVEYEADLQARRAGEMTELQEPDDGKK
ncbi:tetraacyldisaccharide 4'-kinase [Pseudodesulfovibrio sediminis]|uniref:Tetraacyldisaccharide 4'-kinase n=1 Tax=Pseudodesulfovibrio sediminis TaxID=2810563 RepID=A0ABM7P5U1_9BACT|nr:tetraacyldisaccharide 4'-kinase [Pseudodesulfovibrio sediminis]BCS88290.1 tetraacyldisaccharide 4'-kinase [Pseudodesulfovibrio sediminis]